MARIDIPQPHLFGPRLPHDHSHGEHQEAQPDPPFLSVPGQPTRQNLINWMRTNVALMVFISGTLTGAVGMLITVTVAMTKTTLRVEDQGAAIIKLRADTQEGLRTLAEQLRTEMNQRSNLNSAADAGLQGTYAALENRFTTNETRMLDLRHARDGELSAMHTQIAVLESKADRIPVLEKQLQYFKQADDAPPEKAKKR